MSEIVSTGEKPIDPMLIFKLSLDERLLIIDGLNCLTEYQDTDTREVHVLLNKIQGFPPEIMDGYEHTPIDKRRPAPPPSSQ